MILHELLKNTGCIYVHLDWHVGHYAKAVLDEVFGAGNFRNEIVWHYYNKLQGNVNRFASNHDVIYWYTKSDKYVFNRLRETRDKPKRQQKRVWDPASQSLKQARDESGNLVYYDETERTLDDVWRLPYLMPADRTENVFYQTQKPEALLARIVSASTREGDLVMDCFVGSGTTAVVAEKLGRRWVACDLSRFSIHTARKRLLGIQGVSPFVVQNLGKYERQLWQASEFGDHDDRRMSAYRAFILELYHARPVQGYTWLHGIKQGRMVHVSTVDAPVTVGDVRQIATEFKRAVGSGKDAPSVSTVNVLGWDFAFEVNEVARQDAARAGIDMRFVRIPREVLDRRAVEQGDVRFFELAALAIDVASARRKATLTITDFVIPLDDVPEDIQRAITSWVQWIDYWAVDWDNKGDAFHNEWQSYRTRADPTLDLTVSHDYETPGPHRIVVKVIDILGNDTTRTVDVELA